MNDEDDEVDTGSWAPDPFGRHEQRWWSGRAWTRRVRDGDAPGIDPPGVDPQPSGAELEEVVPPITDAPLPIARPDDRATIAMVVAVVVLLALVGLIVVLFV